MRLIAFLIISLPYLSTLASSNGISITRPITYVVSVGVNEYTFFSNPANAEKDAWALVEKLKSDGKYDSTIYHVLTGKNATAKNIKNLFLEISRIARPEDAFIFFFAGMSYDASVSETYLIPYTTDTITPKRLWKEPQLISSIEGVFSLTELAALMEQIQAEDQLVISEAGMGSTFAQNLMFELFEQNPLIAASTERNRLILTTKNLGYDFLRCNGEKIEHGPLLYYIMQNMDLRRIFSKPDRYFCQLSDIDAACDQFASSNYATLYDERSYKLMMMNYMNRNQSRGGKTKSKLGTEKPTSESITRALVIGSNDYSKSSDWNNLKNPLNDASAVSELLKNRFGADVTYLKNPVGDSVLKVLYDLSLAMDSNDKFIFFIAGHGYYNPQFGDGFLVFKDSEDLEQDFRLKTYIQMASLNRMLDNLPSKNVLAVFDVCFGSSFEPNAKNLELHTYKDLRLDIPLQEFDHRKSKYYSRVFLASGQYEVPDYWANSKEHSPFADKLIQYLNEEPAFLSPGKMYAALQGNATEPFLKEFGKHDGNGDFILLKN
jgi:hypothetical protein